MGCVNFVGPVTDALIRGAPSLLAFLWVLGILLDSSEFIILLYVLVACAFPALASFEASPHWASDRVFESSGRAPFNSNLMKYARLAADSFYYTHYLCFGSNGFLF